MPERRLRERYEGGDVKELMRDKMAKKRQKTDLEIAAENAGQLYNMAKPAIGAGVSAIRGFIAGPTKNQRLQKEIAKLEAKKAAKDELKALEDRKKQLEKELGVEKEEEEHYAFA